MNYSSSSYIDTAIPGVTPLNTSGGYAVGIDLGAKEGDQSCCNQVVEDIPITDERSLSKSFVLQDIRNGLNNFKGRQLYDCYRKWTDTLVKYADENDLWDEICFYGTKGFFAPHSLLYAAEDILFRVCLTLSVKNILPTSEFKDPEKFLIFVKDWYKENRPYYIGLYNHGESNVAICMANEITNMVVEAMTK